MQSGTGGSERGDNIDHQNDEPHGLAIHHLRKGLEPGGLATARVVATISLGPSLSGFKRARDYTLTGSFMAGPGVELHDNHCYTLTCSVPFSPITVQYSPSVCSSGLLDSLPARSRPLPSQLNSSVVRRYKLTTRPQGSNHPLFSFNAHLLERFLPLLLCSSNCFTLFALLP